MKFYTKQHRFYCGVDLHADAMHVCILDAAGEIVQHKNIPTKPKVFLKLIKPYRDGLVVGCECMFSWYWLADLCADEGIDFVLGHALYMKAIHGGKAKNDKIDSHKIAVLLRGGSFPLAYTYPKPMRCRGHAGVRLEFRTLERKPRPHLFDNLGTKWHSAYGLLQTETQKRRKGFNSTVEQ